MPMRSKAQSAAMHAAAAGHSTIGIPAKVAQKFVAESHGQNISKLPQHKKPKAGGAFALKREKRRAT
jgi:hypothetical protein